MFREGRTKGLGIVKSVGYDPSKPLNPDAAKEREKEEEGEASAVKGEEGNGNVVSPVEGKGKGKEGNGSVAPPVDVKGKGKGKEVATGH